VIRFTIPGPPFGKPAVARDRFGNRYTPNEVKRFYQAVGYLSRRAAKGASIPLRAPVVTIIAVKARPKRRPQGYPLPWTPGRNPCLAKPDPDNVAKAVCDALTKAGIYLDDQAVSFLAVSTFYAAEGEAPRTEVAVDDLAAPKPQPTTNRSPDHGHEEPAP
jgi:Holliday junction resolvase RusA-like endonuclease